MGKGAFIKDGYIEVNTDAWLDATTGGPIENLTDLYCEFDRHVRKQTYLHLDTVPLFITARCGADWQDEEFASIQTPDGGGTVNLSEDMIIHRYVDPVYGSVALITTSFQYLSGDTIAYADATHDSSDWFDYHHVEIFCPQGHGWSYRGDELTDAAGNGHRVQDVFPDGDIVTRDDDWDSETHGDDRIICPACGQFCDVELPG